MAATAATKTLRFLTTTQVQRLHNTWINPNAQPSQPALLDSAVDSPRNIKHYTGQNNIFQLTATLSEKIMKNHVYQDGNKRTALVVTDMFLKINGYQLQTVPLREDDVQDHVNQQLADAHVAVCTNAITAEQLGELYQLVACKVDELSVGILKYRDESIEE